MKERLQKIMSRAGIASRRKAEALILSGAVTVGGKTITELGAKFDADKDDIRVNGKKIFTQTPREYFLLNKPKNFVSTAKDERGRKTVLDLLPPTRGLYPVGRLDRDTEGLLLVTNDGTLANGLMHPRFCVEKTYVARITGAPTPESLATLRRGVLLDGRMMAEAKVRVVTLGETESVVEIVIHEGRNREVRRMFAALGHEVISLKRTRYAFLTLDGVKRGQSRALSPDEVKKLYSLINEQRKKL